MLLANTLKTVGSNIGRCWTSQFLVHQQLNRLHQLTPISSQFLCYHNFLRIEDATAKYRTGLLNNQLNLHKAIHSHSALYFRNSNLLERKVSDNANNEKNIESADSKKTAVEEPHANFENNLDEVQKLGLFARFKKMAKDYWYVLIPVHVATSACWLGAFYYTSVSGVDIVGLLERYEFNESIVSHLKNSKLGHVAIAYFLYKVATPARYTVTLGGTTFAIKFLSKRGIIKPMPSKDKLVQIYKDKRVEVNQRVADKKQEFKDKKQEFRDKYMNK